MSAAGASAVNAAPPEWDLLLSAAQKNNVQQIHALVSLRGVDPSHANGVGQSALHIAALWGHVEVVTTLLDLKAKVNVKNKLTGATPLHMAVQSHKSSLAQKATVVDLLLKSGADASIADKFGMLPVQYLDSNNVGSSKGDHALVQKIIASLQPRTPPLFEAIEKCDMSTLNVCLSSQKEQQFSNADIIESRYNGQTPLTFAVQHLTNEYNNGSFEKVILFAEIATELVNANVDVNAVSTSEDYADAPLVSVLNTIKSECKKEDSQCFAELKELSLLLKNAGAIMNEQVTNMLYDSVRRKNMKFLQFMIDDMQIDPNVKNRQSMTALHFAARSGLKPVVEYLLSLKNIDTKCKDDKGMTAADAARTNGHDDIADLIDSSTS